MIPIEMACILCGNTDILDFTASMYPFLCLLVKDSLNLQSFSLGEIYSILDLEMLSLCKAAECIALTVVISLAVSI